jgi:hypothetical protein
MDASCSASLVLVPRRITERRILMHRFHDAEHPRMDARRKSARRTECNKTATASAHKGNVF